MDTSSIYAPSEVQQEAHTVLSAGIVDEVLYGGTAGCGKRLSVDTPIPTPTGWKRMGDLVVGDHVFDEKGEITRVTEAHSILLSENCYTVEFSDGSRIEADGEHLWKTMDYYEREKATHRTPEWREKRRAIRAKRSNGKRPDLARMNSEREHDLLEPCDGSIRTTEQIRDSLLFKGKRNHTVSVCGALQTLNADLPLDPYVLGAWLGDGTGTNGSITSADPEIVDSIRAAGFEVHLPPSSKITYRVTGLTVILGKMGLRSEFKSGSKRIPREYLRASVGQRTGMLQGLMDTDGFCAADSGQCEFTTTNQPLGEDVYELLVSLGIKATVKEGKATLNGDFISKKWRVTFFAKFPAFRLRRKLERQKMVGFRGDMVSTRYVMSVTKSEPKLMRCIAVESPSHMYLAGESMIPTHNSVFLRMHPFQTQIYGEHDRWLKAKKEGRYFQSVGWILYLRRNFGMLQQAISKVKDVARQVDRNVAWDGKNNILTFSSGFKYQFGHFQHEDDYMQYDSNEYTGVALDELVQFTEKQYEMIRSRVRTGDPALRSKLYLIGATNPDAPAEGVWVKERFVDPAPQGRVVLKEELEMFDGSKAVWKRMFIPAKITDNPDKQFQHDYERTLRTLPMHIQQARLHGDWNAIEGAFFGFEFKSNVHLVAPFDIPKTWQRFRSMDWGYKKACVIKYWAVSPDGDLVCYRELTYNHKVPDHKRKDAQLVSLAIREVEKANGEWDNRRNCSKLNGPADYQIHAKIGTVGPSIAETMAKEGVYWSRCTKNRYLATQELLRRLRDIPKNGRPGICWFNTCVHTARTMPGIKTDPANPELPMDGGDDHWLDADSYAVMSRLASEGLEDINQKRDEDEMDELAERRVVQRGKWGYYT